MSFVARSILSRSYGKTAHATKQREAVFQPEFREDLRYWIEADRRTALRIFQINRRGGVKSVSGHR